MKNRTAMAMLLITFVISLAALGGFEARQNARAIEQLNKNLQLAHLELADARARLEAANEKLGFLETSKTRVQVTAYALTEDFGANPVFANQAPARTAYAVPQHTLPSGAVLNVALSPVAERSLHASLNDTIVLMSRHSSRQHLARFVDRTAQSETRPVVDILFADAHQARIWGRQSFYAVNISRSDSPFVRR
jgi:hypothetical protein